MYPLQSKHIPKVYYDNKLTKKKKKNQVEYKKGLHRLGDVDGFFSPSTYLN